MAIQIFKTRHSNIMELINSYLCPLLVRHTPNFGKQLILYSVNVNASHFVDGLCIKNATNCYMRIKHACWSECAALKPIATSYVCLFCFS